MSGFTFMARGFIQKDMEMQLIYMVHVNYY
jgi:hypothetical protein